MPPYPFRTIALPDLPETTPTENDFVVTTTAQGLVSKSKVSDFSESLTGPLGELVNRAEAAAAAAGDKIPALTVADLKLITDPLFEGVSISDEGKNGDFFKDNATTLPVDDILVIQDASGNKWVRKGFRVMSLTWFGAKGDGTTDNTAPIQAALTKLSAMGGGVLQVPSGIFLTKKISIAARVHLVGEGKGVSIIKLLNGENTDLLFIPKTSFLNSLTELTFDHNRASNTAGSAIFIEANTNADGAKVDALFNKTLTGPSTYRYLDILNVCVTNGSEYGLRIPAANYLTHIDGLYAYKNHVGFMNESTDNIFRNIVAERNDSIGIRESGGNNKWSNLKVIWNAIERTGYYGGLVIEGSSRSTFANGESQDNYGSGVWIVDSTEIKITNYICDCNGYLNSSLVTDSISSGFRLDNVQNSVIQGFATNYKRAEARPWVQTRAWSEDRRCSNNQINITSSDQESFPVTTSENMFNTHDLVCKRNNTYVGTSKTFEIDEPVNESGVLITANDRISVPCVVPFRNEISFVLDFEYQSKSNSEPVIMNSEVIKLEYVTSGATNHLKATIVTEQGTFVSDDLNFTLVGSSFYRVYCGLRRLNSGNARLDLSISYTASGGIYQVANNTLFSGVSNHLFGVFNNIHFNDYNTAGGSLVGNIQIRLIKFALFPNVLPNDSIKFNYRIMELEKACVYIDFVKPFGNKSNVIRTGLTLPAPSIYYLNKYFITDTGLYLCIKLDDGSYKFISVSNDPRVPIAAKTGNYTATLGDRTLTFNATSGALTCTLPPLSTAFVGGTGMIIEVKKIDSSANAVLVDADGSETIDGSTGFSLTVQNHSVKVQASASGWVILDVYVPNPVRVVAVSASGDGSSTTINITHGLGYTPVVVNVLAMNAASAKITYVTVNSTTLAVHYDVAPASGTNNLSFNFSYRRP